MHFHYFLIMNWKKFHLRINVFLVWQSRLLNAFLQRIYWTETLTDYLFRECCSVYEALSKIMKLGIQCKTDVAHMTETLLCYLVSATGASKGEWRIFDPLRLSFNVAPLVDQDLHCLAVASSGSSYERGETWKYKTGNTIIKVSSCY